MVFPCSGRGLLAPLDRGNGVHHFWKRVMISNICSMLTILPNYRKKVISNSV